MLENILNNSKKYTVWGHGGIDEQTFRQMDNVMQLPVAIVGALMPDAHLGYGLPVGGILATQNEVIPFAIGSDIACRMHLSIYSVKPKKFKQQPDKFRKALRDNTLFGKGKQWHSRERPWHPVMDDKAWQDTGFLQQPRSDGLPKK
ncbi:MAG: RtcB family protein, partial [Aggregatilineales bacterium]